MKVLIEISEDYYELIKNDVEKHTTNYVPFLMIGNGIPLNGTNGEVLLRMFPPSVYFPSEGKYMALLTKDCIVSCSNVEWWNAEYKGVE